MVYKILRGGCWLFKPKRCEASFRSFNPPDVSAYNVGLRPLASDLQNKIDMVNIPSGSFMRDFKGSRDEIFLDSFYMSRYQTTQAQWKEVANLPKVNIDLNEDPSAFKHPNRPVECVTWYAAQEFCDRLTVHTGVLHSLPTETQWEYACRAGTTTIYNFGDIIDSSLANYYIFDSEEQTATTVVGSYPPNSFGLYDMHGNVWEWCRDDWQEDYSQTPTDGSPYIANED
jgi:formylglycine-generating enzyme required for sulfatase activity